MVVNVFCSIYWLKTSKFISNRVCLCFCMSGGCSWKWCIWQVAALTSQHSNDKYITSIVVARWGVLFKLSYVCGCARVVIVFVCRNRVYNICSLAHAVILFFCLSFFLLWIRFAPTSNQTFSATSHTISNRWGSIFRWWQQILVYLLLFKWSRNFQVLWYICKRLLSIRVCWVNIFNSSKHDESLITSTVQITLMLIPILGYYFLL